MNKIKEAIEEISKLNADICGYYDAIVELKHSQSPDTKEQIRLLRNDLNRFREMRQELCEFIGTLEECETDQDETFD